MNTEKKPGARTASGQDEKKEDSEPILPKIEAKPTLGLKPTTYFAKNSGDEDTKEKNTSKDEN